mmetsp:Transcript_35396/g.92127  ORF Transcript_35396/g.92127 Transcript_35396/m.92127 type:complete len:95 (+) Transcript_35396:2935-3219(+)
MAGYCKARWTHFHHPPRLLTTTSQRHPRLPSKPGLSTFDFAGALPVSRYLPHSPALHILYLIVDFFFFFPSFPSTSPKFPTDTHLPLPAFVGAK